MKGVSPQQKLTGLYVLGALYPSVVGGMEIFNYYFLNYQLKQGSHTVYYLGEQAISHGDVSVGSNGHFILLKRRWPARFFYPLQFFFAVMKLRKKIDFAYISYAEQSWILSFSQSVVLRLFNIPYIITIHWGKEPDWKFKYPFVSYFRNAHTVIGVSEPICTAFKKTIPEQDFQYIPPLIPFKYAEKTKSELKKQFGYTEKDRILLFIGSLKGMKNPDKIVEAFYKIGPEYLGEQGIRLILAGGGEMDNELKAMVKKYELEDYIRMEGLVSREKVPDYYKLADSYIISSDYEGTSVSLLEAMVNKSAIIGSDAPGINGMLSHGHNALLYKTTDTAELAETIKLIFSDTALAKKISDGAYNDFINKYSYELMMSRYESVFSSVLS